MLQAVPGSLGHHPQFPAGGVSLRDTAHLPFPSRGKPERVAKLPAVFLHVSF